MTPRPPREPMLTLLETWRMKGPSGKVFDCGIYKTAAGLEVRCQYGAGDSLRSELAAEIGTARDVAEKWRQAVIAKGGFTGVGDDDRQGA